MQALSWLVLASEAGIDGADALRQSVEAVLTPDDLSRAAELAERWKAEHRR